MASVEVPSTWPRSVAATADKVCVSHMHIRKERPGRLSPVLSKVVAVVVIYIFTPIFFYCSFVASVRSMHASTLNHFTFPSQNLAFRV